MATSRAAFFGRLGTTVDPQVLFDVLRPHALTQDWVQCLALTWLSMVRNGSSTLSDLVHRTKGCSGAMTADDAANAILFGGQIDVIRKMLTDQPCDVLTVFDRLLSLPYPVRAGDQPVGASFLVDYSADDRHTLDAGDVEKLRLPLSLRSFYLIDASQFAALPSTIRQSSHLYHYTPSWWVVPENLDEREDGRTLCVGVEPSPAYFRTPGQRSEAGKRTLRIYLAEYAHVPRYRAVTRPRNPTGTMWIAGAIENEKDLCDEAIVHLERARSKGADVVVFPELCDCPSISSKISSWLRDENHYSADTQEHCISLVVSGSRHEQHRDDWLNVARSWDARGTDIEQLRHTKMNPVTLEGKEVTEDIQSGKVLQILSSAIGLQATVICLDLAQECSPTRLSLENVPLSWLWVPSLSQFVRAHLRRCKTVCTFMPTTVACANQGPVIFDSRHPDEPSGFQAGQSFVYSGQSGKVREISPEAGSSVFEVSF